MLSTFTIMGKPQAKQRARQGRYGRFYTPQATREYEQRVGLLARAAGVRLQGGPVEVEIMLYLPDKRRRDLDNMAKSILDGLNGVAWQDDAQVVRLVVEKHVDPPAPRAVVHLSFSTL